MDIAIVHRCSILGSCDVLPEELAAVSPKSTELLFSFVIVCKRWIHFYTLGFKLGYQSEFSPKRIRSFVYDWLKKKYFFNQYIALAHSSAYSKDSIVRGQLFHNMKSFLWRQRSNSNQSVNAETKDCFTGLDESYNLEGIKSWNRIIRMEGGKRLW